MEVKQSFVLIVTMKNLLNTQSIILETGILILSVLVLLVFLTSNMPRDFKWYLFVIFLIVNGTLSIIHIKNIRENRQKK